MLKIGIILGSTRPGRRGEVVAQWVHEVASKRTDAIFEIVDLADFNLPLYDEPHPHVDEIHERTYDCLVESDQCLRWIYFRDSRV